MALTINEMTTGLDINGVSTYLEQMRTDLIENVSSQLTNTQNNVLDAVRDAWVGQSEKKFEEEFSEVINKMKEQLSKEYQAIITRFTELKNNYLNQDANMMGGE